MQATHRCLPLFLLSALPAVPSAAQQDPPKSVPYRVEITLREAGARGAATARKYTIFTGTRGSSSLRANQRVPYSAPRTSDQQGPSVYQFAERSLFIECRVAEASTPSLVSLSLTLHITNLVFGEKMPDAGGAPPATEDCRITLDAPVAPGARNVIGSYDDPVLGRRIEVEAVVSHVP